MTTAKKAAKPATKKATTKEATTKAATPKLTMADLAKRQNTDRWIAGTALVIGSVAVGVAGYVAYQNSNSSAPESAE